MFGFGRVSGLSRKKYNSKVRDIIEDRFAIETDHSKNSKFLGVLAFINLIDKGWHAKASPEDNALFIGLLYWQGCAKAGGEAANEASRIAASIKSYISELTMTGKITDDRARQFTEFYDKNCGILNVNSLNRSSN